MRAELQPEFLLNAYSQGYFPMPDGDKIGWYRPDPRAYFDIDTFRASRSLRRSVRKFSYHFSCNRSFAAVMRGCAERPETWITPEFFEAYSELHALGFAHSIEVWSKKKLVGGVYGVQLGGVFCAESKFHRSTDASKAALWCLVESMRYSKLDFLEVQFMTEHLKRLGALEIRDFDYQKVLQTSVPKRLRLALAPQFAAKVRR